MKIERIARADLEPGRIYRIRSRNLITGAWDAEEDGFIGIREKLGGIYLFTEYYADPVRPGGTAIPIEALDATIGTSDLDEHSEALFALLEQIDKPIIEEMKREDERLRQEAESRRWRPQTPQEYEHEVKIGVARAARDRQIALGRDSKVVHQEWVARIREISKEAYG